MDRPLAGDGSVPDLFADAPIVVSYGFGVDSTAVLGKMRKHGIVPKAILFADPGDENVLTYGYYNPITQWLEQDPRWPEITVLQYRAKRFKYREYRTLWENCVVNKTLPSIAFFRKGCSLKWKGDVMDKWVSQQEWAKECFARGVRVQRIIGFDCSAKDNKRFVNAKKAAEQRAKKGKEDNRFSWVYPLQSWLMHRVDCIKFIETEMGIPAPHKSSCFYCSAMKPDEVSALPKPRLEQIVLMEAIAAPNLTKIKGLWHDKRMTDFIRDQKLLSDDRLAALTQHPEQELPKFLPDQRYAQ